MRRPPACTGASPSARPGSASQNVWRGRTGGKERELGLGSASKVTLADARKAPAPICGPLNATCSLPWVTCQINEVTPRNIAGTLKAAAAGGRLGTAKRLRGQIGAIFDAAAAEEHRPAPERNPADAGMIGHLAKVLKTKRNPVHHPAAPLKDIPAIYAKLVEAEGIAPLALRFTVCRPFEPAHHRGIAGGPQAARGRGHHYGPRWARRPASVIQRLRDNPSQARHYQLHTTQLAKFDARFRG